MIWFYLALAFAAGVLTMALVIVLALVVFFRDLFGSVSWSWKTNKK